MSKAPSLTVLMTVFNGGPFLSAAVRSILAQTFQDFEFLIVDDGSTDGSVAVLKTFAARDPRIRLIVREENAGQTACLNLGLREARGRWIARQDADDLSLPGRLAAQWRRLEERPELVVLGTNGWMVDEAGVTCGVIVVPARGVRAAMPFQNPFIHTAVVFRREISPGELVQYDERFRICQDWELWSRLAESGPCENLSGRWVAYRHRETSLSRAAAAATREECEQIAASAWARVFPNEAVPADVLAAFREGLPKERVREFWRIHDGRVLGEAAAVHNWQAAGALASTSRSEALRALGRTFRNAPFWTVSTLAMTLAIRLGVGPRFDAASKGGDLP